MGFKKYIGKVKKNIKSYYSPEAVEERKEAREEKIFSKRIERKEKQEERIQSLDKQIEEEKRLGKLRGLRKKHQPKMIRRKGSVSAPFETHSPIFSGGFTDLGGSSEVLPRSSEPKKKKKDGGLFDF